jgi:hydrogenase expression/formation protein HypC
MCLAVPGRIERIDVADDGSRSAEVVFPNGRRTVSLLFLPEAEAGDHILAQAGYAMRRLTREQAAEVSSSLVGGTQALAGASP